MNHEHNFQAQANRSRNYKWSISQKNWLQRCDDPIHRHHHHRIADHRVRGVVRIITEIVVRQEETIARAVHVTSAHVQNQE